MSTSPVEEPVLGETVIQPVGWTQRWAATMSAASMKPSPLTSKDGLRGAAPRRWLAICTAEGGGVTLSKAQLIV
jgi:hypothetical protein